MRRQPVWVVSAGLLLVVALPPLSAGSGEGQEATVVESGEMEGDLSAVEPGAGVGLRTDLRLGTDEPGENADYWVYAELSNRGAVVTRLQLNRYLNEDRSGPLILLQEEPAGIHSYMLATEQHPELADSQWEVVANSPEKVVFRTLVGDGALQIEKRFLLEKNSPFIKLEVVFRNLLDAPLDDIGYWFNGGTGLPIENIDYTVYYRNVVVAAMDEGGKVRLSKWSALDIDLGNLGRMTGVPLRFWGVDCQFFASLIVNPPGSGGERRIRDVVPGMARHPQVELSSLDVLATAETFDLPPRGELVHEYLLFNGPKDYPLLDDHTEYSLPLLADAGDFLFVPIKRIARPVDGLLRLVGSMIGDYGLALILTTILIRVCLLPWSCRQRRSTALMEYLQPKLKQLSQQYGKDKEGLVKAQQELFRRYHYNPLGGCLPAMATGLLFVGAWQGLLNSFALRQAEFLWGATWVYDLSAPDRLFPLGRHVFLLGSHFNLLPTLALLLMVGGYFIQPAKEPSRSAKKKWHFWWPVFFCVICYTMPAASWLCFLTFIAGGRVEQMLFRVPEFEDIEAEGIEPYDGPADEEPSSESSQR